MREAIRTKHYSYRTEQSYVDWIKCYVLFHNKRHPSEMGDPEIQAFISFLANDRQVSASTQNQALSAILFLYRIVLQQEIQIPANLVRAGRPKHLPTVLTYQKASAVLDKWQCVVYATACAVRCICATMPSVRQPCRCLRRSQQSGKIQRIWRRTRMQ